MDEIKNFTNLKTWQHHYQIVLEIYKITATFPKDEQFGLTSQLRRSSASITANIAEGFGRHHRKDKKRFYIHARGSNTESQNHIILAKDLGLIHENIFQDLFDRLSEGRKLLNSLIRGLDKFSE
jgi:four helix bundle protein